MSRSRFARLTTVTTAAMLATLLLGVGGTTARTPGWTIGVETAQPATVGPGAAAAWTVTLTNIGKSNISAVYLGTDILLSSGLATPLYISDAVWTGQAGPTRPCGSAPYSGALSCSFGNITAADPDVTVTLTIAFATGTSGSSYAFKFKTTGNGNTLSDGGNSHGDTLYGDASVALNSSAEFAGGYSLPGVDTFTTGTSLTKKNPQSSSVKGPNLFGVTVTEGGSYPDSGTDPCSLYSCIGQWDRVTVGDGTQGPVKLVLLILGSTVHGGAGINDINLYHTGDGVISHRCNADNPPTNMPCITVREVGNNFQIEAWLLHNGGARGLF